MKKFYLSKDGMVSRHKMRETELAGFGILHPDQIIIAYTSDGKKHNISYFDVKVGAHTPNVLMTLTDATIDKIDIKTEDWARRGRF